MAHNKVFTLIKDKLRALFISNFSEYFNVTEDTVIVNDIDTFMRNMFDVENDTSGIFISFTRTSRYRDDSFRGQKFTWTIQGTMFREYNPDEYNIFDEYEVILNKLFGTIAKDSSQMLEQPITGVWLDEVGQYQIYDVTDRMYWVVPFTITIYTTMI